MFWTVAFEVWHGTIYGMFILQLTAVMIVLADNYCANDLTIVTVSVLFHLFDDISIQVYFTE